MAFEHGLDGGEAERAGDRLFDDEEGEAAAGSQFVADGGLQTGGEAGAVGQAGQLVHLGEPDGIKSSNFNLARAVIEPGLELRGKLHEKSIGRLELAQSGSFA